MLPVGLGDTGELRQHWRQAQHLVDLFWSRWTKEYIIELQRQHKWIHPECNLQVSDLVLMTIGDKKWGQWPLGLVISTFPGHDGLV